MEGAAACGESGGLGGELWDWLWLEEAEGEAIGAYGGGGDELDWPLTDCWSGVAPRAKYDWVRGWLGEMISVDS